MLDIITVVLIVQTMYKVDISELTIEGFVGEVGKLPRQTDELFIARTIKLYVDMLGHRACKWITQLN